MNKIPNKIIVVDDDDTCNYVSEIIIRSFDDTIVVSILNDGQEAINHFSDTKSPPDLVLLDINMPFINGFEFLDYYAEQNWNGRTKFAIYSTSSRASDIEKSKSYKHVIDYIEKPLSKEKLVSLFEKFQIARQ